MISLCTEVKPARLTPELEHLIRKMQAYIRAHYRSELGSDKAEYGNVSDARILYTAYIEDSILVTANVKDFLLYPLLYPSDENVLYNLIENEYVKIPDEGYNKIHADDAFRNLLNEFYTMDKEQ